MSKAAELARQRRYPQPRSTVVVQPVHAVNRGKQALGIPTPPIDATNPQGVASANGVTPTRAPDGSATPLNAELLGQGVLGLLAASGYTSAEAVQSASDADLARIKGIGEAAIEKIREHYPANAPQDTAAVKQED